MCCSSIVMNIRISEVWGCSAWGRNAELRGCSSDAQVSSELLFGLLRQGARLPALPDALSGVGCDPERQGDTAEHSCPQREVA